MLAITMVTLNKKSINILIYLNGDVISIFFIIQNSRNIYVIFPPKLFINVVGSH